MKYPRLWENKESKLQLRVMPWWEVVKDGEIEEVDVLGNMVAEIADRPCKFGLLTQIGYLIENDHGIWFGVNLSAAEGFEDKGPWGEKKSEAV
jgi:hypothetical protein